MLTFVRQFTNRVDWRQAFRSVSLCASASASECGPRRGSVNVRERERERYERDDMLALWAHYIQELAEHVLEWHALCRNIFQSPELEVVGERGM